MIIPAQFELENIHGYLSLIAYIHYFRPGHLRLLTDVRRVQVVVLDVIKESSLEGVGRRWFVPEGEAPYPGYCRAPGSAICIPTLCNCRRLEQMWEQFQQRKERSDNTTAKSTKSKHRILNINP